jgi:hypothetical protein
MGRDIISPFFLYFMKNKKVHWWKKARFKNTLCGILVKEYSGIAGNISNKVTCKRCVRSHLKRVKNNS